MGRQLIIIALTGEAGAGKSYAAGFIKGKRLSFAKPVKDIAAAAFGWDGKKDERGRRLLQYVGTECGRDYNPNIWTDKMEDVFFKLTARDMRKKPLVVVIDDLRFNNEAVLVHGWGGVIIKMMKKRTLWGKLKHWLFNKARRHRSERGIYKNLIDYTITAEPGDLKTIETEIKRIVEEVKKDAR